ncbi:MAG: DUF362 domain-containing protein [Candidatus Altiarchaeota archaeon]|nr:DUF362 domain-containing protein [Candidatus Altiarchaeota archaeon]
MTNVFHSYDFDKLLDKLDLSRLGHSVGIKVHIGEKGCTTFLKPELTKKLYDKIVASGRRANLIECNVLYIGPRTRASTHKQLAKEHGFDFAELDILDGEKGDESIELGGCKIGAGIKQYDSLIVLSHFKGHGTSGFGGAVKNIGMGLGSRAGKLDMHATTHPTVDSAKCVGCGLCIQSCPADAIQLKKGKAVIDQTKCIGCAMCISVCPEQAVRIPWGSRHGEELHKRVREYAEAVVNRIGKDKLIFINTLDNITDNCDCMNYPQEPIMPDKGFLLSNDMHAIDLASLKLTKNIKGQVKFNQQNRQTDYELIEL